MADLATTVEALLVEAEWQRQAAEDPGAVYDAFGDLITSVRAAINGEN